VTCITDYCKAPMVRCLTNRDCRRALDCIAGCDAIDVRPIKPLFPFSLTKGRVPPFPPPRRVEGRELSTPGCCIQKLRKDINM
jgi:hypothetical protein